MADAAVEFLLENLKQLLVYHAHLIKDAKNQVEKLETDLRFFKAFLKKSSKKQRKDETLKALVREIRNVVYEAEDIIDTFVTQAAENKARHLIARTFNTATSLVSIAQQVETVCGKISQIYGGKDKIDLVNLALDDHEDKQFQAPQLRKENVVGFEDEAAELIGYLYEKTEHLDVISIIGMPGLGKTTLAGKILHDKDLRYEFPTRIWVDVSQEFTDKDIFLDMLRQMTTNLNKDLYANKTAAEVAQEVAANLEVGKYLIVMDDVWTANDWDKLRIAFPECNKMGKVLITSRQVDVGKHANRCRKPHMLRFLTLDESWLLLQWEVFRKPVCPSGLEVIGKEIANKCNGLPLAVVVIGGILVTKFSASYSAWEKVSRSVTTYLHEDPLGRMEKIISLSYEKLPYHLRECFLYLGMFPEDFDIPARKLIRMWIAEGLIQQKDGISLEESAENNLDELINRNLVRVDTWKHDGRVKTCRIHDMIRDFCKIEAGKDRENFLQEIKQCSDGGLQPQVSEVGKYRRLCIHSNVLNFLSRKPCGPHVRSFVTFSEDVKMPAEHASAIPAGFKLLRVLEVKPIKFSKIPSDFYHLVHLRYITLSFNLDSISKPAILPAAFSKLWNIQTLVVDTKSRVLEVKADIMKMVQLRHFKTNASASLLKPSHESKEGEKLQTLSTVSPESCSEAVLDRARGLKKLGIRGKVALLLDGKIGSFDSFRKLGNLEKLKLINDVYPRPSSEGKLDGLPSAYKFPSKLRSLTLSNTWLDWSHMSIVGSMENLQVLKLKENAFTGTKWVVGDRGFDCLEVLQIVTTNLTLWLASGHSFPILKHLELKSCDKLQEVPIALADIRSFEYLDLYQCKQAAASARKIEASKKQQQNANTITAFKLLVFPSDLKGH